MFVAMNRNITNAIRFILDECIPPLVRDARWFMYPFFYIWYKGKKMDLYMDFKSKVYQMTDEEYATAYRELDCLATDRPTDMNEQSIALMISKFDTSAKTILDVGCGRGYWLNKVTQATQLTATGCDMYDNVPFDKASYVKGNIYKLPFEDNSFDIVTCHHTIEHLLDLQPAIAELKRVAKKQLMIVTPKQKYYYYTMDMHVNFFPIKEYLQDAIKINTFECHAVWGDWVYIGTLNK
jgi:ubiquinone/menaquinone biosynthesis C-methylase UbiE